MKLGVPKIVLPKVIFVFLCMLHYDSSFLLTIEILLSASVQEVYDDELGFSERLVFMGDQKTKVIQYFATCTHVNNNKNKYDDADNSNNKIISLHTSHIEVYCVWRV